jgi:hypothetical protein
MNWLQRAPNQELIDYTTGFPQRYFRSVLPGLRQEFTPFTLLEVLRAGRRLHWVPPPGYSKIDPSQDVDGDGMQRSLAYTVSLWGQVTPQSLSQLADNAKLIGTQIAELKAKGVRIVLLFLPMNPGLETAPSFAAAQSLSRQLFPPSEFEWFEVPEQGSYHTSDSIHLTVISGIRLSQFLLEVVNRVL